MDALGISEIRYAGVYDRLGKLIAVMSGDNVRRGGTKQLIVQPIWVASGISTIRRRDMLAHSWTVQQYRAWLNARTTDQPEWDGESI
jgi:hypothetical protein